MKYSEAAKAARVLITEPSAWTQGSLARTADGDPVGQEDAGACSFCLLGAAYKACPVQWETQAHLFTLHFVSWITKTYSVSVGSFNDSKGHAACLQLLDDYVAYLEAHPEENEEIDGTRPSNPA